MVPTSPLRGSEGRGETRGSAPGRLAQSPTSPLRGGRRSKADAKRTAQLIRVGVSLDYGTIPPPGSPALRLSLRPPLKGEVGTSFRSVQTETAAILRARPVLRPPSSGRLAGAGHCNWAQVSYIPGETFLANKDPI